MSKVASISSSKSGLRKKFKTNSVLETEGVWFEMPEAKNDDGTIPAFLIARVGVSNIEHGLAIERLTAQYRGKTLTNTDSRAITKQAFIEVGVKGWRNVYNDAGETLPFHIKTLSDLYDDMPDIYFEHVTFANNADNFKDGKEANAVK